MLLFAYQVMLCYRAFCCAAMQSTLCVVGGLLCNAGVDVSAHSIGCDLCQDSCNDQWLKSKALEPTVVLEDNT